MFDLYFKNANNSEVLVQKGIPSFAGCFTVINKDLSTRRPGFRSYYTRYHEDDDGNIHVDYGSHYEFYIAKKVEGEE